MYKSCCFIGHRKIEYSDNLYNSLKGVIENLILKENVKYFLFGSKSEFNSLCYNVVTELKDNYPNIVRVSYTCKSEAFYKSGEEKFVESFLSNFYNKKIKIESYEEEYNFKNKYVAGKATYIERNIEMIDNSNICIFYYNKDYFLSNKNSGTKIAYNYAIKNNKKIINMFI